MAAVGEGAVWVPVRVVGAADERCVDTETAGRGEGAGIAAEAEGAGAEAGGGEDRVDDIVHLHSCQLSASFCFVSVGQGNRSVLK